MKNQATGTHCMVQLNILSKDNQQQLFLFKSFPILIGRGKNCHLQLDDMGIWENHLELNLNEARHFTIRTVSDASAMINGEPLEGVERLHNGDFIGIGMVKIQFWLGAVQQKNLGLREAAAWTLLLAVTIAEIYLLLWLG